MSKYSIEKVCSLRAQYATPFLTAACRISHSTSRRLYGLPHIRNHRAAGWLTSSLQFDDRKGPTWHCIVGRNFGSFVTHETKHFIYFYLGHCAILLFKTQ